MTRWAVALSAVLFLLLGTATTQVYAAVSCGEPLLAPTYHVGDNWTWRGEKGQEATDEVIQVEGDTTQIKSQNGDIAFVDKDRVLQKVQKKNGEVVTKQGAGTYTTVGKKVLDFPLQVGKKWDYSYVSAPSSNAWGLQTYFQHFEVVACEEVTTPAGKFPAFKVRVDQSTVGSTGGTYYMWYAPDVKTTVKRQYIASRWWSTTSDTELIKYECK